MWLLDLQELKAVLEHMEMLQTMRESLREQQFQAIHEFGSPWRASTAGVQNKDVPRSIPTTHGHQLYQKLVRRPRSPSVRNLTQTPTASIVQKHETQHLIMPTLGQPLSRSSLGMALKATTKSLGHDY
jgi:hypothetical protein